LIRGYEEGASQHLVSGLKMQQISINQKCDVRWLRL